MLVEQGREAKERGKLSDSRRLIHDKSNANWLKNDKTNMLPYSNKNARRYLFLGEILIDCFARYKIYVRYKCITSLEILFYSCQKWTLELKSVACRGLFFL